MKDKRPVNLNLFTMHFPLPAIISILHRISGVTLYFATPAILWLFAKSLESEDGFKATQALLSQSFVKVLVWLILAPFFYHLVAGIRHLLLDFNFGVDLKTGRFTAFLVAIFSVLLIVLAGMYLW